MKSPLRVAIVYDRVNSWGGAERVLLALHKIFPKAPLYTSVYDPSRARWADNWDVRPSLLQSVPWLRSRHQLIGWLMPWAFRSFNLAEYDVVISVTSEFAKAVQTSPSQLHLCYLLTPTRYLWSHQTEYLRELPPIIRVFAKQVMNWLRKIDQNTAKNPDTIVPISKLVAKRCRQYYGRPAQEPIYPPIPKLAKPTKPKYIPPADFFFTWGRHVAYKKIDLTIQAAIANRQFLVVAGRGSKTKCWQKFAQRLDPDQQYIKFVGQIAESEVAWYLQHAKAAVFPQEEDFGITAMEAVSQGCPVIINVHSGAAELLRPDQDALFLPKSNIAMLRAAMKKAMVASWSKLDIQRQASQYAEANWQKTFFDMVNQYWKKHQKQIEGIA
jgi:glycosyltransferase involved in cell wall biosynthesis